MFFVITFSLTCYISLKWDCKLMSIARMYFSCLYLLLSSSLEGFLNVKTISMSLHLLSIWFIVYATICWESYRFFCCTPGDFCSLYVSFVRIWRSLWDWKGQLSGLICLGRNNPVEFLLRWAYVFLYYSKEQPKNSHSSGTKHSREHLEDWNQSQCSSSECNWIQTLRSNLSDLVQDPVL